MDPATVTPEKISTFAEAEDRLAEALPGYEQRPQQQALAAAVESAIATERHLIAEAGCGTGKSLGYAIPAILSGKRVVISTATTALQDQIVGKDLPFLAEHLGIDFKYAVLKGRSRYVCLNKAENMEPSDIPSLARVMEEVEIEGFDGERVSFSFDIPNPEWSKLSADSEDCQTYECKQQARTAMKNARPQDIRCYAERARLRARQADVVVVNHALYLTDLKIKDLSGGVANMLPEHDVVVFDEAHEVEEYAANVFGADFKEVGILNLAREVTNFVHRMAPECEADAAQFTGAVQVAAQDLWKVLEVGRIRKRELIDAGEQYLALTHALQDLANYLMTGNLLDYVERDKLEIARKRRERVYRKAQSMSDRFEEVVTADFADLVRWVEEETWKNEKRKVLKVAPINVATHLRSMLFDLPPNRPCRRCEGSGQRPEGPCYTCAGEGVVPIRKITAVLTSATLAVNDTFEFVAGRLGVDTYDGLDVGSPFDFNTQARLYVPKHLPEPTPANRQAWSSMMVAEIGNLVKASDGRALLLFTSNKEMRNAHATLAPMLPYKVLMQGQGTNKALAEQFMADPSSVLFATRSFMTGVDFQGEACSLVVIDKLPFPVPTEPVVEAKCEAIKAAGKSDFSEFTIPVMTLVLKQAFGRLIRHRNDTGVVAILDPRLLTKGYGKKILGSLPEAPVVESLDAVTSFFAEAS